LFASKLHLESAWLSFGHNPCTHIVPEGFGKLKNVLYTECADSHV